MERVEHDKSKEPQRSRLARLREAWAAEEEGRDEDDYQPDMPPLTGGAELISYLYEVGPVMQGGMGPAPLSFLEIRAWQNLLSIRLPPSEVRLLRWLSVAHLNELHAAEKRDAIAPWKPEDAKPEVTATQAAIRALANL